MPRWTCSGSHRTAERVRHVIDLGFDEVGVRNVGRNQKAFIPASACEVPPKLKWKPTHWASTVASAVAIAEGLKIIARTGCG
jgi:hypothetical protein